MTITVTNLFNDTGISAASGGSIGPSLSTAAVGDLVLVSVNRNGNFNTGFTSVSDSAGNSYNVIQPAGNASVTTCALAWCIITHAITTSTTWSAVTQDSNDWVLGPAGVAHLSSGSWIGLDTSTSINQATAATAGTLSTGTLSSPGEIIVGTVYFGAASGPITQASGFTSVSGTSFTDLHYGLPSSASSVTDNFTFSSHKYSAVLASFKAQFGFASAINPAAGGSTSSGSSSTATSSITIPIGSFVLAALDLAGTNSVATSVTDSVGNSYTIIAPPANTGTFGCAFAYCPSTTNTISSGTSWTSSNSNSQNWFLKGIWWLSGVNTVDQFATKNFTSASSTFTISTSTLLSPNTFCWGYIYPTGANSITSNSPWTDQYNNQFNAIPELIQLSSTSAVTYSGLCPAATAYSAIVVAFRPIVTIPLSTFSQALTKMVATVTNFAPNTLTRSVFWIPRQAEVQHWQGFPTPQPAILYTNPKVSLFGFATTINHGLGSISGTLPIFAVGQSIVDGNASPSGVLPLSAQASSLTSGSALETVIKSLSAFVRVSSSMLSVVPSTALSFSARLAALNTANSSPSGKVPLSAHASGSARIIPASKPIAYIFGLSRVSNSIKSSLSLNAIVLMAKSAVRSAARSSVTGITSLLGRTSSQSTGGGALTGSVILLSATTVSQSTGRGAATGKGVLNALMATISMAQPSIAGRVSISASSAIRSAQRGTIKYIVNLASVLRSSISGVATISSFANVTALLSNGSAQIKSRAQGSFALILSAKTSIVSSGHNTVIVTLKLAGRAAFSSIARSVARGTLPLFAYSINQLKTTAKVAVPFLLTARATIASHSLVSTTVKAAMTGKGKIATSASTMFSFAGSKIPLIALAAIKVRALLGEKFTESIEGLPVSSSEPGQIGPPKAQN